MCSVLSNMLVRQDKEKKAIGLLQYFPIPERLEENNQWTSLESFERQGNSNLYSWQQTSSPNMSSSYIHHMHAPWRRSLGYSSTVVKCFRMPKDIVSDYDARFTGWFQIKLFKLLGWELRFSIENHPQIDGQTKCTNTLLEEYLKHYVFATQMNQVAIVEITQLSYNLQKTLAIRMSLFKLAIGQQPIMTLKVAKKMFSGNYPTT